MSACASWPDLWFDDDTTAAVQACCTCPLIEPCLRLAMQREGTLTAQYRFGVWGGLTGAQRALLASRDARRRKVAA